jgi:hypothetical protein
MSDQVYTVFEGPPAEVHSTPQVLELDHVYGVLGHSRRRYLCYSLLGDTQWSLTDLATRIAAWENEISTDEVTEPQRKRVYVSLYHTHVPKLVDKDVIEFDDEEETIRPAENAEQALRALDGIGSSVDIDQETHAGGGSDDSGR